MTSKTIVPAEPADSHLSGKPETIGLSASPRISIRPELPADAPWVENLHGLAFGPGRFARTAFRVREQFAVDRNLCLIAEYRGKPVGSARMTPISIGKYQGYLLGPLATDPDYRNKGAGRALVREVSEMSLAKGGEFVLLVGDAPYYRPLGYEAVPSGAIIFPGPVDPARILVCCKDRALAGRLVGVIAAVSRA